MPFKQNSYTLKVDKLTDYFDIDDGQREVPVNMTLTSDGHLSKDTGVESFSELFTDPVLWIKSFKKKTGTQYLLISSGTKIYSYSFTKNKFYPLPTSQTALTGTLQVTQGSTNVIGTSTLFTTELVVGQTIVINGEYASVITITDDTHIIVDANIVQASASGLSASKNTDATYTADGLFGSIEYDDNLYFGNAIDDYSKFDGTVITKYVTLPKGNIFEVFEDRVFVSGVTAEPLSLYYSDVGVPTTFDVASVIKPLGTDFITGLANYYGSLIIFKQNSLWKMTFVYEQVLADYLPKIELMNNNYGCVGFRAYSWVENDIWFFTGDEVRAIGFRDQQTGVLGLNPSVISNDIKETLKLTTSKKNSVVFYFERKFYLAVSIEGNNDIVFVSHLLYKNAWTKIKDRVKASVRCFTAIDTDVYYSSSTTNKIYKWTNEYNDDGVAIYAYVLFKEYESKDFSQTNIFRYTDLKFKNFETTAKVIVGTDDFDVFSARSKNFFIGTGIEGEDNSLGEITLGENLIGNAFGEEVSASTFLKRRISHLMRGFTYRLGISNNVLNDNLTLVAFEITGHLRPRRYYSHGKVLSI